MDTGEESKKLCILVMEPDPLTLVEYRSLQEANAAFTAEADAKFEAWNSN